jgi:hypothetical protein
MVRFFVKDDGRRLPVDDRYLSVALSPTSPGTNYWDPPPPSPLNDRQRARILLQTHQVVQVFRMAGVQTRGKHLLDIGTGNGMVPRLLLEISDLARATGVDPFLDGEHKTSWQPHDHDLELQALRELISRGFGGRLDIESYGRFLQHENYTVRPETIDLPAPIAKDYRFAKVGAHDLDDLDDNFDLFYCKAIEHIPDWSGVFRAMSAAAAPYAIAYFKHRPFYSYLGPHRYASTNIPWGHLLLTDEEYRRFANEFHAHRAEQMIDFFFSGLSYPRHSVSDMLRIAAEHGWAPLLLLIEPPRYIERVLPLTKDVEDFWDIKRAVSPSVSVEEMFSGMYHIMLRRIA